MKNMKIKLKWMNSNDDRGPKIYFKPEVQIDLNFQNKFQ